MRLVLHRIRIHIISGQGTSVMVALRLHINSMDTLLCTTTIMPTRTSNKDTASINRAMSLRTVVVVAVDMDTGTQGGGGTLTINMATSGAVIPTTTVPRGNAPLQGTPVLGMAPRGRMSRGRGGTRGKAGPAGGVAGGRMGGGALRHPRAQTAMLVVLGTSTMRSRTRAEFTFSKMASRSHQRRCRGGGGGRQRVVGRVRRGQASGRRRRTGGRAPGGASTQRVVHPVTLVMDLFLRLRIVRIRRIRRVMRGVWEGHQLTAAGARSILTAMLGSVNQSLLPLSPFPPFPLCPRPFLLYAILSIPFTVFLVFTSSR